MAETAVDTPQDIDLKSEVEPDEIAVHCDKCTGFIVAVEKPTHRLEHIVVFRMRVFCKRCRRVHIRRITFNPAD